MSHRISYTSLKKYVCDGISYIMNWIEIIPEIKKIIVLKVTICNSYKTLQFTFFFYLHNNSRPFFNDSRDQLKNIKKILSLS